MFTTFKDTAGYLYDNLKGLTETLGIAMAMVSGDETHATAGASNFNAVLTNFAPMARQGCETDATHAIDLLVATDCISEGQNLQDCDTVLNYDIHWNPVRLVQRFGRIDRIGSRNPSVHMVNYWPTEDMDTYLRLQNRVQARMALADLTASGDEDPFSKEDMARDLRFRDDQLRQLREDVPHLEDLGDGPVLADFTLDDFLTQLQRYLERNKAALEAMPPGVYAVTGDNGKAHEPGVIFCLRQRNAGPDQQHRPASPFHPHYLVHVQGNGAIRYGWQRPQHPHGLRRRHRRPNPAHHPAHHPALPTFQPGDPKRPPDGALRDPLERLHHPDPPSPPPPASRRPGPLRRRRFQAAPGSENAARRR